MSHKRMPLDLPSARRLALLLPVGAVLLLLVPAPARAQSDALPANQGFATVHEMLVQNCAACHSWARSYQGIASPDRVTPSRPDESALYLMVASDQMPLERPKLTGGQKLLLRTWIEKGATASEEPLTASAGPGTTSTATASAGQPAAPKRAGSLGRTIRYHEIAGYTSAGLLLGAGAVGTAKILTFMRDGHAYRDANGIDEQGVPLCRAEFESLWNSSTQQTLRWTHVGLLVGGNALYLGNAITGFGFPRDPRPGLTPRRIHRYAFYTHAALMAANIVLGFVTTDVLSRGDHEAMLGLAIAHAAVGVAVPLVMTGAGIAIGAARR